LTDLTLPFSLLGLGAGSSLQVLALAAEENILSLWAAIPDKTAVNSERVVNPAAVGRDLSGYRLTQALAFPSLGSGVLPNQGRLPGASLTLAVSAGPGVTLGYLAADLLDLLVPGVALDGNLDGAPDVALPANQAPLPVGSGPVRYEIRYSNDGIETARNVTFRASAAGALQLDSPATVNLGDVAPGISGTVSFAGSIHGGAASAELDVTVADEVHGDFDWLWMQAPVDNAGPVVAILAPQGYAPTRPVLIVGSATDDAGVPAIEVEVTGQPGGSRILACPDPTPTDGGWVCAWEPGDLAGVTQVTLRARGTDSFGNVGDWSPAVTLAVDIIPPTVDLTQATSDYLADGFINGLELFWRGRVVDDQQAAGLTICQGRALGDGCQENALFGAAVAPWRQDFADQWLGADGIPHDLALSGEDSAGNISTTALTRTFVVDTVAPVITVTAPISDSFVVAVGGGGPPITGSVTDGGGVAGMTALLFTPDGQFRVEDVLVDGDAWRYLPQLETAGEYLLLLVAWDRAGNATLTSTFRVAAAVLPAAPLYVHPAQPGVAPNGSVTISATVTPPQAGLTVSFTIVSGGGGLSSPSAQTDATGVATVLYTAGTITEVVQIEGALAAAPDVRDRGIVYVAAKTTAGSIATSASGVYTVGDLSPHFIRVMKTGAGTPPLGWAEFGGNPCPAAAPGSRIVSPYVDVMVDDTAGVDAIVVTLKYTDTEYAGQHKLFWCNLGVWQQVTETVSIDTVQQTLVFTVTGATTPALFQLAGTPFVGASFVPNAATVGDFVATGQADRVQITWQTLNEIGLYGFHLHRGLDPAGPGDRITGDPLPAQGPGGLEGFAYSYDDFTPLPAETPVYYWLEELHSDGTYRHGPLRVGGAGSLRIFLPAISRGGAAGDPTPTPEPGAAPEAGELTPGVYLPLITQ
jgi:hypothetical protein